MFYSNNLWLTYRKQLLRSISRFNIFLFADFSTIRWHINSLRQTRPCVNFSQHESIKFDLAFRAMLSFVFFYRPYMFVLKREIIFWTVFLMSFCWFRLRQIWQMLSQNLIHSAGYNFSSSHSYWEFANVQHTESD